MSFPSNGAKVAVMVVGPLGKPVDLYSMHVVRHVGVIVGGHPSNGGWFSAQNAWTSLLLNIDDEGITWTVADDDAAFQALRAAYALRPA